MAFFVDIPLCTTEARCPISTAATSSDYVHFEPESSSQAGCCPPTSSSTERRGGKTASSSRSVAPTSTTISAGASGPSATQCRYDDVCEGVWGNYVRRYGWEEMSPVPMPAKAEPA